MKPARFHGDALERIREFPAEIQSDMGHQIELVQSGRDPDDWKPMPTVGKGVREIRVRDETGAYRAIYLATLPDAVHVYHAFKKKTQKTSKHDLEIAERRYREHVRTPK